MALWPNGTKTRPSISSNYGPRAPIKTPAGTTSSFHTGVDFVGFSDVKAVEAGTVIYAAKNDANGNEVRIQHANGAVTRYFHMADGSLAVSAGQSVAEGQKLGVMGKTGMATGVHLHFRVDWPLGTHHDPLAYMAGRLSSVGPSAPSLPSGVAALTAADVRGWTYKQVQGDGLLYWEPTGSLAKKIMTGLRAYGYTGPIDGVPGINTRKALQRLAQKGGYTGPIDGKIGKNTVKGLQEVARSGGYTGPIDGIPAEYTWNGVRKALGQ